MSVESDYSGRIDEFYRRRVGDLAVLDVKSQIGFERFAETFDFRDCIAVFPWTDYAGFHATDPNWYEDGKYRTGLLRVNLFRHLEHLFRETGLLEDDQDLTPVCHYSDDPGTQDFIFLPRPRPNLVVEVTGGEKDSWGQFMCLALGERRFFQLVDDPAYIRALMG